MSNGEAVYCKFECVRKEPAELIPPKGWFFILSKVAACGQQGFMRFSAWAGATEAHTHTHIHTHMHTHTWVFTKVLFVYLAPYIANELP